MYEFFCKKTFAEAVKEDKKISWQLAGWLSQNNEPMPGPLCKRLALPKGSSYSQGIKQYKEKHLVVALTNRHESQDYKLWSM